LYNDFSLLFWSWDYIELFFLELFYVYVVFTHIVFLGLFSYELLCIGLLLFRFFRFSILESMHHLSSVLQNIAYEQQLYGGIFISGKKGINNIVDSSGAYTSLSGVFTPREEGYHSPHPLATLDHVVTGLMMPSLPFSGGFTFAQVFSLILIIFTLFYAGSVYVGGGSSSGNGNLPCFNNYLMN
jgi:hypothetical protein